MKFPLVLRSTLNKVERDADRLRVENSNLRVALAKAEKNDHRDPKTGRFVKA